MPLNTFVYIYQESAAGRIKILGRPYFGDSCFIAIDNAQETFIVECKLA